jgi:hypothetical protein
VVLHTFWSVKGGSGVTVTAAGFASVLARGSGRAVIVDLCGDQPAALGLPEPDGPGVRDWLAAGQRAADGLARLVRPVHGTLSLLPRGSTGPWPYEGVEGLVTALLALGCPVVVDAGTIRPERPDDGAASHVGRLLAGAGRSVLVIRPCYLALRRAAADRSAERPLADAMVVLVDGRRALDARDAEQVVGVPVVASIEVDPSISSAVDAGVFTRRLPRSFGRAFRGGTAL